MSRRRYGLTEREWSIIAPLLPSKPRGVPRVDDRMVLNGILWRFRTGSSWSEITERYGIATTCYNRFVRWRRAGVWDRLLEAVSEAYDGDIVMIDVLRNAAPPLLAPHPNLTDYVARGTARPAFQSAMAAHLADCAVGEPQPA